MSNSTPDVGGLADSGDSNHHPRFHTRLPDKVKTTIENYTPQLPRAQWIDHIELIRYATLVAAPPNPSEARMMLLMLTRLCIWAKRTGSVPVDVEHLFEPAVISRFVQVEYSKFAHARLSENESALLKLTAVIKGEDRALTTIADRRSSPRPYTSADEGWVRHSADLHPTLYARRTAHAMLGLCRGAGLTTLEVSAVRTADVSRTADGLVVEVGGKNSRIVPIDSSWSDHLEVALSDAAENEFLIAPTRQLRRSKFISALSENSRGPQPIPRRLRSTWIVERFNTMPVVDLLYAAGLNNVAGLDNYLPWATEYSDVERLRRIRAGEPR